MIYYRAMSLVFPLTKKLNGPQQSHLYGLQMHCCLPMSSFLVFTRFKKAGSTVNWFERETVNTLI